MPDETDSKSKTPDSNNQKVVRETLINVITRIKQYLELD